MTAVINGIVVSGSPAEIKALFDLMNSTLNITTTTQMPYKTTGGKITNV